MTTDLFKAEWIADARRSPAAFAIVRSVCAECGYVENRGVYRVAGVDRPIDGRRVFAVGTAEQLDDVDARLHRAGIRATKRREPHQVAGSWDDEPAPSSPAERGDALQLEYMTEPELAALMKAMARSLQRCADEQRVERPQFVLLLFNDPRVAQYIASVERRGAIEALREAADRLERRQDVRR